MSRKPRIEFPGAFYHVLARGNNKQKIFNDRQDYCVYVERLKRYQERYKFALYAYVLMVNHIHLLIETGMTPLSKIMQGIQQSYTAYFHKKNNSVGHVFQSRYKAILCQRDVYLLELVRYIHLNPVRAALVNIPEDYPWSSHQVYIGRMHQSFVEKGFVFNMFDEDEFEGEKLYRQFICDGVDKGSRNAFDNVVDQIYLGSKDFIEGAEKRSKKHELPESKESETEIDVMEKTLIHGRKSRFEILDAVAEIYDVPSESILSKSKEHLISKARSIFVYVAVRHVGMSNKSVAEFLRRDMSTISCMIRRIDKEIKNDKILKEQMEEVIKVIKA